MHEVMHQVMHANFVWPTFDAVCMGDHNLSRRAQSSIPSSDTVAGTAPAWQLQSMYAVRYEPRDALVASLSMTGSTIVPRLIEVDSILRC